MNAQTAAADIPGRSAADCPGWQAHTGGTGRPAWMRPGR